MKKRMGMEYDKRDQRREANMEKGEGQQETEKDEERSGTPGEESLHELRDGDGIASINIKLLE